MNLSQSTHRTLPATDSRGMWVMGAATVGVALALSLTWSVSPDTLLALLLWVFFA